MQVVLTKLSKSLDKDSVRVDGVGPASITEVSFQEISITGKWSSIRKLPNGIVLCNYYALLVTQKYTELY